MKQKKFELALTELNLAIQMNPSYSMAYINRGQVNEKLENYEEAVRDYQQAHNLSPGNLIKKLNHPLRSIRPQLWPSRKD